MKNTKLDTLYFTVVTQRPDYSFELNSEGTITDGSGYFWWLLDFASEFTNNK